MPAAGKAPFAVLRERKGAAWKGHRWPSVGMFIRPLVYLSQGAHAQA